MNPSASYLLDSLSAPSLRYIIPVYQRKYAWDEEQCLQLWEDVLAVGKSDGGSHFTGSFGCAPGRFPAPETCRRSSSTGSNA